jgi:hypothetical protein
MRAQATRTLVACASRPCCWRAAGGLLNLGLASHAASRTKLSRSVGVASRFEISQLCLSRTSRKP